MQITPPFAGTDFPQPTVRKAISSRIGAGDIKCAVIDRRDIGKFVARIIADERTLNRYVFCWTEHVSVNETIAIADRVSGRKMEIEDVSVDEFNALLESSSGMERIGVEYAYSIWVRGDNTVENAKKEEYGAALDARELYPGIEKELKTVEEFAKELYLK